MQYLGPIPGIPSLNEESTKEISLDSSRVPVDAFCLLVLDPDQVQNFSNVELISLLNCCFFCLNFYGVYLYAQVDYLNLKSNQRLSFTSGKNDNGEKYWTSQKLSP